MKTYEQSALASTAIRKSAFARSMSSKRDLFTWWQSFQQKKDMTQTKRHNHSKQEISALLWKILIPWSYKSKDKGKSSF